MDSAYIEHAVQKVFPRRDALTNWSRDKIAAISQTALSNAFSYRKMYEFR